MPDRGHGCSSCSWALPALPLLGPAWKTPAAGKEPCPEPAARCRVCRGSQVPAGRQPSPGHLGMKILSCWPSFSVPTLSVLIKGCWKKVQRNKITSSSVTCSLNRRNALKFGEGMESLLHKCPSIAVYKFLIRWEQIWSKTNLTIYWTAVISKVTCLFKKMHNKATNF